MCKFSCVCEFGKLRPICVEQSDILFQCFHRFSMDSELIRFSAGSFYQRYIVTLLRTRLVDEIFLAQGSFVPCRLAVLLSQLLLGKKNASCNQENKNLRHKTKSGRMSSL